MAADSVFTFFPMKRNRAHEAFGPGATAFACALAAGLGGPVLWISEARQPERLNPEGVSAFFDPAELLWARTAHETDTLAVAEEALRADAVCLVVAELGRAPGLTAGRRLQLAAEAGRTMALCLLPGEAGSNATETRWHCAPLPRRDGEDSTLQRWCLKKNKTGILQLWDVRWDVETRRVIVVSEAGSRAQRPPAAG